MESLREQIMDDKDPVCPHCYDWVKPDIVFFGEQLPRRFFDEAEIDCLFSDLMICIGTSLEVYPFAGTVYYSTVWYIVQYSTVNYSKVQYTLQHST